MIHTEDYFRVEKAPIPDPHAFFAAERRAQAWSDVGRGLMLLPTAAFAISIAWSVYVSTLAYISHVQIPQFVSNAALAAIAALFVIALVGILLGGVVRVIGDHRLSRLWQNPPMLDHSLPPLTAGERVGSWRVMLAEVDRCTFRLETRPRWMVASLSALASAWFVAVAASAVIVFARNGVTIGGAVWTLLWLAIAAGVACYFRRVTVLEWSKSGPLPSVRHWQARWPWRTRSAAGYVTRVDYGDLTIGAPIRFVLDETRNIYLFVGGAGARWNRQRMIRAIVGPERLESPHEEEDEDDPDWDL